MKKNKLMIVLCVMIALMATAYAFLSETLSVTSTGSISTTWNVRFTKITYDAKGTTATNAQTPTVAETVATMSANLENPGDEMNYEITLSNSGSIDAIIENVTATAEGTPAIVFSIEGIKKGQKLAGGATTVIKVRLYLSPNVPIDLNNASKVLTVSINAVQDTGQDIEEGQTPSIDQPLYLSNAILTHNTAYADNVRSPYVNSDAGIDLSQISSDENGKGLYYTSTNTENNLRTYYFRGDVKNNYVKFGKTPPSCKYKGEDVYYLDLYEVTGIDFRSEPVDGTMEEECEASNVCIVTLESGESLSVVGSLLDEGYCNGLGALYFDSTWTSDKAEYISSEDILWRIVRINEDGSIRIITQDSVGTSAFNTNYNDNAYVGYMYGKTGSSTYAATHANTNNSTIKSVIDDWYLNDTNLSSYVNSHLADAGFCNDRSVVSGTGVGTTVSYYGAYDRLYTNKTPQYACPNVDNDLFTTNSATKGNKALINPIGLITADEVIYAGSKFNISNSSYYLNTGESYWTMSPREFTGAKVLLWYVYSSGSLNDYRVDNIDKSVRPVINLKSNIEISGGDGTINQPYVIK